MTIVPNQALCPVTLLSTPPYSDEENNGELTAPSTVPRGKSKNTTEPTVASDGLAKFSRAREYPALKDTVYLDFAASPPVPISAIQEFATLASTTLLSNPHSLSPSSSQTSDIIDAARRRVLTELFNLGSDQQRQWTLVWTSGATAACRMLADNFDWGDDAEYIYTMEAHTSLVGIRGVALAQGARAYPQNEVALGNWLRHEKSSSKRCLFAYPAQCNATGRRLSLEVAKRAKRKGAFVLVDAAALLATSRLDLADTALENAPDFIVGSLYKTYAYPTGLGFLLIKNASMQCLQQKKYFGGGSVDAISVQTPRFAITRGSVSKGQFQDLHARLEDGTIPFLSIAGLVCSMNVHRRLFHSLDEVAERTRRLSDWCEQAMQALRHGNGGRVCVIHKPWSTLKNTFTDTAPGPTIGFSVLRSDGAFVGHHEVGRLAAIHDIHLRTGGLCNTGVLAACLGLSDDDIEANFRRGRACWDEEEFGGVDGQKPIGIVRISFGAASTAEDVRHWLEFLKRYWVCDTVNYLKAGKIEGHTYLSNMTIYPIKSCGGFQRMTAWPIEPHGLKFDREWMIVNPSTGQGYSQKKYPKMSLIRSTVDLEKNVLHISVSDFVSCDIPLERCSSRSDPEVESDDEARVCADGVKPRWYIGHVVDDMLTDFLGIPCALVRLPPVSSSRHTHFSGPNGHIKANPVPILLSNESPFLMIHQDSVETVNDWLSSQDEHNALNNTVKASCFRGNLVLNVKSKNRHQSSFQEDSWNLIQLGTQTFQFLAKCRRCQMVCIDQDTGVKTKEPYSILSKKRRDDNGRIYFGTHLMHRPDLSQEPFVLDVGCEVKVISLRED